MDHHFLNPRFLNSREKHRVAWRVTCYSAVATVAAWIVLVPLKLQDALLPHMTWPKIILLPPIGFAVWPAVLFWDAWRTRAR
jgi:hypothetical protein